MTVVFGAAVAVAGCGGGAGAPGEPLISGALTGEYKGIPFTPAFGFAIVLQGTNAIGLGDGPLNCASPEQDDPPPGTNAIVTIPEMAIGTYSSRLVNLYRNVGQFEGRGTNTGTVTITAVNDTTVAGSISYSSTDEDGLTDGLSGTFEVVRCPN